MTPTAPTSASSCSDAYDRGVKASSRARRRMRSCDACTDYRTALRGMRRSFAALSPAGAGPLAMAGAKLLGFGGAGGGVAAGGSATSGGGAAVGGARRRQPCKVAAVVCTAALTAGGAAVEVRHLSREQSRLRRRGHVQGGGTRAGLWCVRPWRCRRRRPSPPERAPAALREPKRSKHHVKQKVAPRRGDGDRRADAAAPVDHHPR